jgi:hypothetical protein
MNRGRSLPTKLRSSRYRKCLQSSTPSNHCAELDRSIATKSPKASTAAPSKGFPQLWTARCPLQKAAVLYPRARLLLAALPPCSSSRSCSKSSRSGPNTQRLTTYCSAIPNLPTAGGCQLSCSSGCGTAPTSGTSTGSTTTGSTFNGCLEGHQGRPKKQKRASYSSAILPLPTARSYHQRCSQPGPAAPTNGTSPGRTTTGSFL